MDDHEGLSLSYKQEITVQVHQEANFMMRERDWLRIRKRIDGMKKQERQFSAIGWTCVGLVISAGFAALSWIQPYAALGNNQSTFSWVWVAIIALGVLGILLGAGMFWAAYVTRDHEKSTAAEIVEEMDEIHTIAV
jgi:hypothetical protein